MKKNTCLFLCALISGSLVSAWDPALLEETTPKKSDHFAPINKCRAFAIEQDAQRIQLKREIQNLEWDLVALQEDIDNDIATNSISLGHNSGAIIINTELQENVKSKYLKKELLKIKIEELAAINAQ